MRRMRMVAGCLVASLLLIGQAVWADIPALDPRLLPQVVQAYYLKYLDLRLSRPWLYQPIALPLFAPLPNWDELIEIEGVAAVDPLSLPKTPIGPVIRITR